MVSPAGYYCETQTLSYCVPGGSAFKLPASSDYDLNLNVGGSTYYVSINGTSYGDGGFIAGGPTGLIEMARHGAQLDAIDRVRRVFEDIIVDAAAVPAYHRLHRPRPQLP